MICVYLRTDYHSHTSDSDFFNSLWELSGFIDLQTFDHLLIGGDLNTTLSIASHRTTNLSEFMVEHNLTCVDIQSNSITHTYERDDGLITSWPDHFLASASLAGNLFSLRTVQFGSNLSDHLLLFADLARRPVSSTPIFDHTGTYYKTNWQLVSDQDIE